jgi:hypothetical protein
MAAQYEKSHDHRRFCLSKFRGCGLNIFMTHEPKTEIMAPGQSKNTKILHRAWHQKKTLASIQSPLEAARQYRDGEKL